MVLKTDIPDYAFSANMPELAMIEVDAPTVSVSFALSGGVPFYSQTFVPSSGREVVLRDLGSLFEAYLQQNLIETFSYRIVSGAETIIKDFTVQYAAAEVDLPAADFLDRHFLTMMQGERLTAPDRKEFLHFICRNACTPFVVATYDNIQPRSFEGVPFPASGRVQTLEVSPMEYHVPGSTLLSYAVKVGEREQRYRVDHRGLRTEPALLFTNSFGVQETFYCTGTFRLEGKHDRRQAYISGLFRSYSVEETRTYKANTGYLTNDMANWAEDLLRSREIYLLEDGLPGKAITVTDSKLVRDNTDDELPSINFEYRYAQRNHNLLRLIRAGRIFDNSFDRTFN